MREIVSGGCQCGRIRYRVDIDDVDAILCHCRMCQRASGNVSLALKTVRQADVAWDRDPEEYESSAIARRGFCSACGTSLTFRYTDGTDKLDLTVGSFDEPERFRPTSHFGAESMQAAWLDTRELPRMRSDEYQPLNDRWQKVGGQPDA